MDHPNATSRLIAVLAAVSMTAALLGSLQRHAVDQRDRLIAAAALAQPAAAASAAAAAVRVAAAH